MSAPPDRSVAMSLAVAGLISNSDSVHFAEVERFSNWCRDSSLDLNVKKTKEMLTDFRKAPAVVPDFFIDGVKAERMTVRQKAEF